MPIGVMNETVPPCHVETYVGGSQFREQIVRVLLQDIVFYILYLGMFVRESQIAGCDGMPQFDQSGHDVPSNISVGSSEQYVQFIDSKNMFQGKRG